MRQIDFLLLRCSQLSMLAERLVTWSAMAWFSQAPPVTKDDKRTDGPRVQEQKSWRGGKVGGKIKMETDVMKEGREQSGLC